MAVWVAWLGIRFGARYTCGSSGSVPTAVLGDRKPGARFYGSYAKTELTLETPRRCIHCHPRNKLGFLVT